MGFDKGFQSTHPSGVRQTSSTHIVNLPYFNPRTPVGCDLSRAPCGADDNISIHAPQWGATLRLSANRRVMSISIHAPQWGATQRVQYPLLLGLISIHAPQWGATTRTFVWAKFRRISIHAPQWGATYLRRLMRAPHRDFNPRTPVGCDNHSSARVTPDQISIHAPQWGATPAQPLTTRRSHISIHAPQWGATRPVVLIFRQRIISIHAPQWGATPQPVRFVDRPVRISIHAPQWGATPIRRVHWEFQRISIHAPQWGATVKALQRMLGHKFQSTHPSGVRRPRQKAKYKLSYYFNPRTPVGCDSAT